MPLRQEVVSVTGQRRGQRIVIPVKKLFAREKRPYGLGMVGKLTNRTYRKRIDSYVKRQIEDMDDHRWGSRTLPPLPPPPTGADASLLLHPPPAGRFSPTGSRLSTCSSPCWPCASTGSRPSAFRSTRRLIL